MRLLIEDSEKEAYRSLTDDHLERLPDLAIGDIVPVSVAILDRIVVQWNSLLFSPVVVSGYTIRVALGGFRLPDVGTFPITYESETSDLYLSADPTAEELEEALNVISEMSDDGGVDVVGAGGFFFITFRDVGVRNLIESDATDLVPASVIRIVRSVTGGVATREVQTLEVRQNVGAIATLATNSSSPSIATPTVVVQGDATHNHQVRVTLPSNRWGGRWTFTAVSVTSDFIGYSATQEQIQAAIAAMSSVGANNVSVTQETENDFLVLFKNGKGNLAITGISADGTSLKVIGTKSGSLDLTVAAAEFLIPAGQDSAVSTIEVEATPGGGSPEKILQRSVTVNRSVIPAGT